MKFKAAAESFIFDRDEEVVFADCVSGEFSAAED